MSLPYEDSTAGPRALDEIRKILTSFGCSKFGTMVDTEANDLLVQFEYRGRRVQVKASAAGYAARWLKEYPYNPSRQRRTKIEYERVAMEKGQTAMYSILRDWIKGQVAAIECGVLSFEGAFLGQILLPSGKTVLEHAEAQKLLAAPDGSVG